jgi:hypothetical protein
MAAMLEPAVKRAAGAIHCFVLNWPAGMESPIGCCVAIVAELVRRSEKTAMNFIIYIVMKLIAM